MNLIAICGEPAVGKTTLLRRFREEAAERLGEFEPFQFGLVRGIVDKDRSLWITGVYDGSVFEGGDKLSMAVQPVFIKMLHQLEGQDCAVIVEGDRLTNASLFREFPTETEGIIVEVSEEVLAERHAGRGAEQSDKFRQAKRTKVQNLEQEFGFERLSNNTEAEQDEIIAWLAERCYG